MLRHRGRRLSADGYGTVLAAVSVPAAVKASDTPIEQTGETAAPFVVYPGEQKKYSSLQCRAFAGRCRDRRTTFVQKEPAGMSQVPEAGGNAVRRAENSRTKHQARSAGTV